MLQYCTFIGHESHLQLTIVGVPSVVGIYIWSQKCQVSPALSFTQFFNVLELLTFTRAAVTMVYRIGVHFYYYLIASCAGVWNDWRRWEMCDDLVRAGGQTGTLTTTTVGIASHFRYRYPATKHTFSDSTDQQPVSSQSSVFSCDALCTLRFRDQLENSEVK